MKMAMGLRSDHPGSIRVLLLPLLLCLARFQFVASLQVARDSPCSSFCLDEDDPETWITRPEDIICKDNDFDSEKEGQKFQRCLSCLQDSDYAKDDETDQQWFIYNLRYAFDYCILGYPNATNVESSPCATSESCGHLGDALKEGLVEPDAENPYEFCKADKEALLSEYQENCLACVQAGNSQRYLSNFMIAMRAGCEQQPAPGILVGLNDTVFITSTVQVVNPASADSESDGPALSPPIIAAIVISGVVGILIIAACAYMQIRKKKNREARLRRASPLSFRCQTHVTPKTADFPRDEEKDDEDDSDGGAVMDVSEKPYADPSAALSSNPVVVPNSQWAGSGKVTSIVTNTASISQPRPVHSPHSGYPSPPNNHNNFMTPTSTTSTHSNAPLLNTYNNNTHQPYQPSKYHYGNSQYHQAGAVPGLAISSLNATNQQPLQQQQQQQQQRSPPTRQRPFSYESDDFSIHQATQQVLFERPNPARELTRGRASPAASWGGGTATPNNVQTSFPPPPTSSSKR